MTTYKTKDTTGVSSWRHEVSDIDQAPSKTELEGDSERDSNDIIDRENVKTTFKTWVVIWTLSATFLGSFWPAPVTGAIQARLSVEFGDPNAAAWWLSSYTLTLAVGFMLFGANSDLFGRRWFILIGTLVCGFGQLIMATSKNANQYLAGIAVTGMGAANSQLALCAIPELLPNKYRHIGVVIADGLAFVGVIVGPIVGRVASDAGHWQWLFYASFIFNMLIFGFLFALYRPPKHPRGVAWNDALRGLDYFGALLFTAGGVLILIGIIYTNSLPASNPRCVGPMVAGSMTMAAFGAWGKFSNVQIKLCPPEIFEANRGRSFTAPFIITCVVTVFYYAMNIIWPTMLAVFYIDATTSRNYQLAMTLPPSLGLLTGAILLTTFGNMACHWKWTLTISFTGAVLFGCLLALVTPYNKSLMITFVFLGQMTFGWAQYLSIAFVQFGVTQKMLGVSSGLSGTARYAGASFAVAIYTTVLNNTQRSKMLELVPAAATSAGLPQSSINSLIAAFPLGATALEKVPGINNEILAAAGTAFKWSYAHGLRQLALTSLAFGGLGIICCLLCENIDDKMNNKTETFLENDINKDRNEFH